LRAHCDAIEIEEASFEGRRIFGPQYAQHLDASSIRATRSLGSICIAPYSESNAPAILPFAGPPPMQAVSTVRPSTRQSSAPHCAARTTGWRSGKFAIPHQPGRAMPAYAYAILDQIDVHARTSIGAMRSREPSPDVGQQPRTDCTGIWRSTPSAGRSRCATRHLA
jgi:hypothetical protein